MLVKINTYLKYIKIKQILIIKSAFIVNKNKV